MSESYIRIGTIGHPGGKKQVYSKVDVVELKDARATPPKTATAKRWRKEAPNRVAFTVQLPGYLFETPPSDAPFSGDLRAYGSFQITEENLGLWEKTQRFADGLEATALVLLTPPEFTPAKAHCDALSTFLNGVQLSGRDLVWEPRGPWDHHRAADFAAEHGMILSVDPLRDVPPSGDTAYLRLGPFAAMGSQVGVYDLTRIKEMIAVFDKVTCVFDTPRALDDAGNMRNMLNEAE